MFFMSQPGCPFVAGVSESCPPHYLRMLSLDHKLNTLKAPFAGALKREAVKHWLTSLQWSTKAGDTPNHSPPPPPPGNWVILMYRDMQARGFGRQNTANDSSPGDNLTVCTYPALTTLVNGV